MKTRIKNKEECTKILLIEIPLDLVERARREVYQDIKKIAKVPGFRIGMVPEDLLVKHYAKTAEEETLKQLIPEGYKKAVENHGVVPISLPRFSNVNFETGKPLTFEAEVDVRPNVKLKNYRGIKVKKKKISVSREETDEAILGLRNVYAKYKDVAGPVKKGNHAVCDMEAFVEGKPITKKNNNMWVLADKDASLLGMGEELIGLEKGRDKEIETKLPDNYPDKKYAGKPATFKVRVNEIKEKELAPLDDGFARSLNAENLEALKKEIESRLLARKENIAKSDMKNQILDRLLKNSKFSVPSGMVARQKEVLTKRLEMQLSQKGLHKDEIEKNLKELGPKLAEDAKDRVRIYFILDDIAVKEKLEVSDKDIDERLKSIAAQTGKNNEEVKKYYEKENLLDGLAEEVKEGKVLEFLLKEAEIKEEKGG